MRKIFLVAFGCLVLINITGCGGPGAYDPGESLLLPAPKPVLDPSDIKAHQAVRNFLGTSEAPLASSYDIARIDLNDDGRREALVLFKTPYGYWCGKDGCTLLIFEASNTDFTLRSSIQPIREPLYISDDTQNGWHTLVVRISGRNEEAKNVALAFDGESYPNTPTHLPPYLRFVVQQAQRLFQG